jgi:hypothetical protein
MCVEECSHSTSIQPEIRAGIGQSQACSLQPIEVEVMYIDTVKGIVAAPAVAAIDGIDGIAEQHQ